jgi:alpha-1,4-digalacturonate transport system substrate-binding protein
MHSQLTVTGAFVNATLFEQAGIEMPGEGCHLGRLGRGLPRRGRGHRHPFPMAIDRSGHRVAGPAISYGAALFG